MSRIKRKTRASRKLRQSRARKFHVLSSNNEDQSQQQGGKKKFDLEIALSSHASPYYLQSYDHPRVIMVSMKLIGEADWYEWSNLMKL